MPVDTAGGQAPANYVHDAKAFIFDESNPKALCHYVSKSWLEYFRAVPEDMLGLLEQELEAKLFAAGVSRRTYQLELENKVRMSFWREYAFLSQRGPNSWGNYPKMSPENVANGICDRTAVFRMLSDPLRCAWILCPPTGYQVTVEEALYVGLRRLREFLNFPLVNRDGTPNTKAANVVIKIVEMLDNRLHGAATQKIDHKMLRVNIAGRMMPGASPQTAVNVGGSVGQEVLQAGDVPIEEKSMEQLERELRFLEERAGQAKNVLAKAQPIEVTGYGANGDEPPGGEYDGGDPAADQGSV